MESATLEPNMMHGKMLNLDTMQNSSEFEGAMAFEDFFCWISSEVVKVPRVLCSN